MCPPLLSIEKETTEKRKVKKAVINFIYIYLQFVITGSKLIVLHCYRKTNYCVYCLDEFWFSDGSLSDKAKFNDPGLMPLPDTATGLDWSHLVDAARAFEGNRKSWIKITVHYTTLFGGKRIYIYIYIHI